MSIKNILDGGFISKLAYAVTASTVIGGGTVVLNSQTRLAVLENIRVLQDARLERIENKIDRLLERAH